MQRKSCSNALHLNIINGQPPSPCQEEFTNCRQYNFILDANENCQMKRKKDYQNSLRTDGHQQVVVITLEAPML